MDKKFFVQNMIKLEHAYLGWKITDNKNTMGLWYEYFRKVPQGLFERAVDEFIMTSRFHPTIAGIMEIITRFGEDTMLEASEAWNRVKQGIFSKGIRNVKEYAQEYGVGMSDPDAQALKRVGVSRIKNSMEKELPFLFNEFKAVYDKQRTHKARSTITQGQLAQPDENLQLEG